MKHVEKRLKNNPERKIREGRDKKIQFTHGHGSVTTGTVSQSLLINTHLPSPLQECSRPKPKAWRALVMVIQGDRTNNMTKSFKASSGEGERMSRK